MQVSVENTSTLGRRLKVQIPGDEVQSVIRDRMNELSLKARVSGFRVGKIPKNVLEQKFGNQVRQEALGKVIESSLPLALKQNDLQPAGRPVVEDIVNEFNQDLEYTVVFEIFPSFELSDYTNINVEKYIADIAEKDVDNAIEKIRNQFADWVVVDRPAQLSDRLTVDYTSTMNGKPYDNNTGKDVLVEIGSHLFIGGFEQGLIGAEVGEEKILDLTFPDNWRIEKLKGKPVQFTVAVKVICEKHPAELNEAFAKKIGAESKEEKDIRARIRESLEKQLREMSESRVRDQVTNALLNLNPIPLPQALVEREMNALHEEFHRKMGDKPEAVCQHHGLVEKAEKRVALGLILNEVIRIEKLKPDEEQVRQRIANLSKMFGNEAFLENMYYDSEELLSGVQHTVLLDQALEFVLSKATVTEKKISVLELFKREDDKTILE